MKIIKHQDHTTLGAEGAAIAVEAIRHAQKERGRASVLLAAAPSQLPILSALLEADLDHSTIDYFHMDEYVGLDPTEPQSFGNWLERNYFDTLAERGPISFARIVSLGDPQVVADGYASHLPQEDFDLVLCGIGINGHLAFNDPGTDLADPVAVRFIRLADASRQQQVDEGHFGSLDEVPEFAITLTIPRMLAARTMVCSVLGEAKAQALKSMVSLEVTNQIPATALQSHPDVSVLVDEEAYSLVP